MERSQSLIGTTERDERWNSVPRPTRAQSEESPALSDWHILLEAMGHCLPFEVK